MEISRDEVLHVAKLSKLSFEETDLADMTSQLGKIIDMFSTLNEINTDGVEVTMHGGKLLNVMREDVPVVSDERDALLANAPAAQDGFIKVPAMLDNGEGEA